MRSGRWSAPSSRPRLPAPPPGTALPTRTSSRWRRRTRASGPQTARTIPAAMRALAKARRWRYSLGGINRRKSARRGMVFSCCASIGCLLRPAVSGHPAASQDGSTLRGGPSGVTVARIRLGGYVCSPCSHAAGLGASRTRRRPSTDIAATTDLGRRRLQYRAGYAKLDRPGRVPPDPWRSARWTPWHARTFPSPRPPSGGYV